MPLTFPYTNINTHTHIHIPCTHMKMEKKIFFLNVKVMMGVNLQTKTRLTIQQMLVMSHTLQVIIYKTLLELVGWFNR